MSLHQRYRTASKWIAAAGACSLLLLAVVPAKADLVQKNGKGATDWTSGTIKVTGAGAPPAGKSAPQARLMANRAAVVDGYRQLAEIINGVHVDSETVVKDFVTESDEIRTKVSAFIKGAVPGQPRYLSDGSVEVEVTCKLYGQNGLSGITTPVCLQEEGGEESDDDAVLPHRSLQIAMGSLLPQPFAELLHLAATKAPPKRPVKQLSKKTPPPKTKVQPIIKPAATRLAAGYTGVIINCQGKGAQPAMSPTILDSSGGEIYIGRREMPESFADFVINEGIVGYATSEAEALKLDRAGSHPLILKAKGIDGRFRADAVLDNDSAQKLVSAEAESKVMTNAKVIFIL